MDYRQEVKADIKQWLDDNGWTQNYILNEFETWPELFNKLAQKLFLEDSVTGNGSGSYTFNTYKALENIINDRSTVAEALEFYSDNTSAQDLLETEAEKVDVMTRCYVLEDELENALVELGIWKLYQEKGRL